jgi:hypothetical protein
MIRLVFFIELSLLAGVLSPYLIRYPPVQIIKIDLILAYHRNGVNRGRILSVPAPYCARLMPKQAGLGSRFPLRRCP